MIYTAEIIGYDYDPGVGSGKFLNLRAKGDKIVIRIAGKPIKYFVHWINEKPNVCDNPDDCKTCLWWEALSADDKKVKENADKRRKQVFIWPVIDRTDGEAKVFKGGVGIFLALKDYAVNPKWGDPITWDVEITRTETNPANFYSVIPDPDTRGKEITKEEKESVAKLGNLIDSLVVVSEGVEEKDLPF